MQNRVGSKIGGGGQLSESQQAANRRDRLRKLALETIDLSKDPYFMRTNVGTIECKLCLTIHPNEGNYMAHTQGKRHQSNLGRRAAQEATKKANVDSKTQDDLLARKSTAMRNKLLTIGKPGYKVTKSRNVKTKKRTLTFELDYPELGKNKRPCHRFLSAFEQNIDPPDRTVQYLVFACHPYETIAFKIPNLPIDKRDHPANFHFDDETKKATFQFTYT